MANELSDQTAELIYSRLNTRETSTLTIATVASSASLVLVGFVKQGSPDYPALASFGVLFPMLGLFYREVTLLTVDHDDLNLLRDWKHFSTSHITVHNHLRRAALRYLLVLPVLLWFVAAPISFSLIAFALIFSLVIVLTALEAVRNDPLKATNTEHEGDISLATPS